MKRIFPLLSVLIIVVLGLASCAKSEAVRETVISNPLPMKFGDPFLLYAADGKYYMYGTSLADGFEAYVSDNLKEWTPLGQVYRGGDSLQWNVDCFWAPEVYERGGKYYLFFSANSRNNPTAEGENFKLGVAVADSPAGPFKDLYNRPVFEVPYPVIDANVLFDKASGKNYIYFSRCCYKHPVESEIAAKMRAEGMYQDVEESWIYGAELKDDFSGIVGEPQLLLAPPTSMADRQAEWESRSVAAGEVNRRWTEGSFIFERNGTYYIMYSANAFYGPHYAVGYATAKSPLGPFTKAANNPVLSENVSRGGKVNCTGHNMVIEMPGGELYTVYHGRMADNPTERVVMMDRVVIDPDGTLRVEGPTTDSLTIKY